MPALLNKRVLRGLFFLALAAVLFSVGYRVWAIREVKARVQEAPQGQAYGPAEAALTIVEFMDYRCPACRKAQPVLEAVRDAHPDVRIVIRNLPRTDDDSIMEARLALAAGEQGRFIEMHEMLARREEPVGDEGISELARRLGLDEERLRADMMSPPVYDTLTKTLDAASVLRIDALPSFLIGGTVYAFREDLPQPSDFDRLIARHGGGDAVP